MVMVMVVVVVVVMVVAAKLGVDYNEHVSHIMSTSKTINTTCIHTTTTLQYVYPHAYIQHTQSPPLTLDPGFLVFPSTSAMGIRAR